MAAEPTYADLLRQAIERDGWSQRRLARELAALTGNAFESERSAVAGYLKKGTPTPERAALIAQVTGVPELGRVEDPRLSRAARLEDRLEAIAEQVERLLRSQSEVHEKLDRLADAVLADLRQRQAGPRQSGRP